ncbi:MAG TPA: hypothetical protein V6C97_31860 [Oculatellaceae cyanobacterium]
MAEKIIITESALSDSRTVYVAMNTRKHVLAKDARKLPICTNHREGKIEEESKQANTRQDGDQKTIVNIIESREE